MVYKQNRTKQKKNEPAKSVISGVIVPFGPVPLSLSLLLLLICSVTKRERRTRNAFSLHGRGMLDGLGCKSSRCGIKQHTHFAFASLSLVHLWNEPTIKREREKREGWLLGAAARRATRPSVSRLMRLNHWPCRRRCCRPAHASIDKVHINKHAAMHFGDHFCNLTPAFKTTNQRTRKKSYKRKNEKKKVDRHLSKVRLDWSKAGRPAGGHAHSLPLFLSSSVVA